MKIAFDLDDVLSSFNLIWHKWHNEHYSTNVKMEDIDSYFITEVFGITQQETNDRVFEFYKSNECANLPVEKDAKEVLIALKKLGHEVSIITSRDTEIEEMTRNWLSKNFPGMFDEIIFTKQFSRKGIYNNDYRKSQACKEINADMLVEDAPFFAEDVANEGIKVALIEKTWNKSFKTENKNIIKIKSLLEILNYLDWEN